MYIYSILMLLMLFDRQGSRLICSFSLQKWNKAMFGNDISVEHIHTFNNMLSYFSNAGIWEYSSHTRNKLTSMLSVIHSLSTVCVRVGRWCVVGQAGILVRALGPWPQPPPDPSSVVQPSACYTCRHPLDSMAHNAPGCILVHSLTFLLPTYIHNVEQIVNLSPWISPVFDQQLRLSDSALYWYGWRESAVDPL